ncbi:PH domain-containing protein [Weissella viridescens]|uniref:PH domain-containing protein n=1 Tax=Weissella viridescens TaxID=1629 RepID=UPI003AF25A62
MVYTPKKETLFSLWVQDILSVLVLIFVYALIALFVKNNGVVFYSGCALITFIVYILIDCVILAPLNWHYQRVILKKEYVIIKMGILVKKKYVIPIGKITLTKKTVGPIEYFFNLSTLGFITLSGEIYTPALSRKDINNIQEKVMDQIVKRGI